MKIMIELDINPFTVPNFVTVNTRSVVKGESYPAIALKDIDSETLDRLCRDFRNEVFSKAGKTPPPEAGI